MFGQLCMESHSMLSDDADCFHGLLELARTIRRFPWFAGGGLPRHLASEGLICLEKVREIRLAHSL